MRWYLRHGRDASHLASTNIAMILEANALATNNTDDRPIPHGMSLEDRRDFVSNVLVTKRVIANKHTKEAPPPHRSKNDLVINNHFASTTHGTYNETTTDDDTSNACSICLGEYQEGDKICWSHNQYCRHVFHRECILEWLLRHDECPCCRHNFLSLDSDDENEPATHDIPPFLSETSSDDSITPMFLRGLNLFDLLTTPRASPPSNSSSSNPSHRPDSPHPEDVDLESPEQGQQQSLAVLQESIDEIDHVMADLTNTPDTDPTSPTATHSSENVAILSDSINEIGTIMNDLQNQPNPAGTPQSIAGIGEGELEDSWSLAAISISSCADENTQSVGNEDETIQTSRKRQKGNNK
eukprot:CAMPEP_0202477796 /NCGR_PEP_ID=MMETSP1360-20130828/94125_1 /ASSEMBLY_ACC=CAM_ASM_000848 /TAXON_ID=515479 /ORGANISM="Licmophora paradoxa, Strain CCMP2313" /LENGTH=353 /DNA_ID=CAMNT_0049105049 /DNA_START=530 /DNA_END=1591 /DNA_ORIENTATION=+